MEKKPETLADVIAQIIVVSFLVASYLLLMPM
jgi:hypothetical protein